MLFTIEPGFNQYDEARTEALYRAARRESPRPPGRVVGNVLQPFPAQRRRNTNYVFAEGAGRGTARQGAYKLVVQQDFFETMGIPLRMGRSFTAVTARRLRRSL